MVSRVESPVKVQARFEQTFEKWTIQGLVLRDATFHRESSPMLYVSS
jgi:hypothetical protein